MRILRELFVKIYFVQQNLAETKNSNKNSCNNNNNHLYPFIHQPLVVKSSTFGLPLLAFQIMISFDSIAKKFFQVGEMFYLFLSFMSTYLAFGEH